jgi:hypothetical protein
MNMEMSVGDGNNKKQKYRILSEIVTFDVFFGESERSSAKKDRCYRQPEFISLHQK